RDNQLLSLNVTPKPSERDPSGFGVDPARKFLIESANPTMPAFQAGMRPGDELLTINGDPIETPTDIREFFKQNGPKEAKIGVIRAREQMTFTVKPVESGEADGAPVYLIGITQNEVQHLDKLPLVMAFQKSLETNRKFSLFVFEVIQRLIERRVSIKQMDGPI